MLDLQNLSESDASDRDEDVDTWLPAILDLQGRIVEAVKSMRSSLTDAEADEIHASIDSWPAEETLASLSPNAMRSEWETRYDQDRSLQRRLHALRRQGAAVVEPELGLSQFTPTQHHNLQTPKGRSGSRPYSLGGTATHGYVPFDDSLPGEEDGGTDDEGGAASPVINLFADGPLGELQDHGTPSLPGATQILAGFTQLPPDTPHSGAAYTPYAAAKSPVSLIHSSPAASSRRRRGRSPRTPNSARKQKSKPRKSGHVVSWARPAAVEASYDSDATVGEGCTPEAAAATSRREAYTKDEVKAEEVEAHGFPGTEEQAAPRPPPPTTTTAWDELSLDHLPGTEEEAAPRPTRAPVAVVSDEGSDEIETQATEDAEAPEVTEAPEAAGGDDFGGEVAAGGVSQSTEPAARGRKPRRLTSEEVLTLRQLAAQQQAEIEQLKEQLAQQARHPGDSEEMAAAAGDDDQGGRATDETEEEVKPGATCEPRGAQALRELQPHELGARTAAAAPKTKATRAKTRRTAAGVAVKNIEEAAVADEVAETRLVPSPLAAPPTESRWRRATNGQRRMREWTNEMESAEAAVENGGHGDVAGGGDASDGEAEAAGGAGGDELGRSPAHRRVASPKSGKELCGWRVRVWRAAEGEWRSAQVVSYGPKSGKHKVEYLDGVRKWLTLENEQWEMAPRSTEAAHAGPSPRAIEAARRCAASNASIVALAAMSDFTPGSQGRLATSLNVPRPRRPAKDAPRLSFSGVSTADAEVLAQVGFSLGALVVPDHDLRSPSHLVVGCRPNRPQPKRTLKVLHAILRGAWVVSPEWLLESIDAGQLLPPERFELHATFPGAREARRRAAAGEGLEPLAGVSLFVHEKDADARDKLLRLAEAAGARVTSSVRGAAVCVGTTRATTRADVVHVRPEWLYDSCARSEALPYEAYA